MKTCKLANLETYGPENLQISMPTELHTYRIAVLHSYRLLVSYAAVWEGALRYDTTNGCVGDYQNTEDQLEARSDKSSTKLGPDVSTL